MAIYDRIGGMQKLDEIVTLFYQAVMEDKLLNPFFSHIDLNHLSNKFKLFLAYILGAPFTYSGKNIHHAHDHLEIHNTHFDKMVALLEKAFIQAQVDSEVTSEAMRIISNSKTSLLKTSNKNVKK